MRIEYLDPSFNRSIKQRHETRKMKTVQVIKIRRNNVDILYNTFIYLIR